MGETLQTLSLEIELLQKKLKLLKEIKDTLQSIERLEAPGQINRYPNYPIREPWMPSPWVVPNPFTYGDPVMTTTSTTADPKDEKYIHMDLGDHVFPGTSEDFVDQFNNNVD